MITRFLLIAVIVSGQFCSVRAQGRNPARERFNWKEYQDNSIVIKDSIDYDLLQGNWISYQGSIIGNYKVEYQSQSKSTSLQIRGDTYRNTLAGDFYPFLIEKNLILFIGEESKIDSAYINLITNKDLIICYRKGDDFYQTHYKK